MSRPFDRLRDAIANLDRAELRSLATKVGISREALTDFAEINIALEPAALAKLEEWHDIFSLRAMCVDPRRAVLCDPRQPDVADSLMQHCAITRQAYTDFFEATSDLDSHSRAALRAFLAHGGPPMAKGAEKPAAAAPAPLSAILALRGRAKAIINAMDAEALRAFIAARSEAA